MELIGPIAVVLGAIASLIAICVVIAGAWRWWKGRGDSPAQPPQDATPLEPMLGPAPPPPATSQITAGGAHLPPLNPNFTGREEELKNLRASLEEGGTTALTQAITGLGGVGKTQLAIEYAHRHRDDYDVVWWVRSEEPAQLAEDFGALAKALDLPEKDAQDQTAIRDAVCRWLESNDGWLLVFDNAPDANALKDYRPGGGRGHVIITSRDPNWSGVAKPLPVEVWPRNESVEFLGKRIGRTDEAAGELAEELGDLPLALEQAAAYIIASGISLEEYLTLYRDRRYELWPDQPPPLDYDQTVTTTWAMAMEGLREKCAEAADLLNLIAFLAPDDIPRDLLGKVVADPLVLNHAIAALQRYSLISADEDSVSIHRLVQAVTRDRLPEEEERKWAADAVRLMNAAFPFDQNDPTTWPESGGLLPHALAAAGHAAEGEVELDTAGGLLNEAGLYLRLRAEFAAAKAALERALAIFEKAYGEDHPQVATVANNLGSALQDLGDLKGAREHFERALAIDEKVYGSDHPEVATDVNNLGGVLRAMGDLKGARERFERALAIFEKAHGEDHPQVATVANNLGGVLQDLGDLTGAREHYERALAIDEKAYGSEHPTVANRVNNLGSVLQDQGDLKGARERFERALRIYRQFLGEDHPHTQLVRENLERLDQG